MLFITMSARFGFHRVRKNFAYILCVWTNRLLMKYEVILYKLLFTACNFSLLGEI